MKFVIILFFGGSAVLRSRVSTVIVCAAAVRQLIKYVRLTVSCNHGVNNKYDSTPYSVDIYFPANGFLFEQFLIFFPRHLINLIISYILILFIVI